MTNNMHVIANFKKYKYLFVTACSKRNQAEIQKVISRNSVDSY